MAYTPENNPYIPGDPYSYDLKWMVNDIKYMEAQFGTLDENVDLAIEKAQLATDEADRAKEQADDAADSAAAALLSEQNAKASEDAAKDYADNIADPVSGIVTDWLNDHITQPTTPVVDTSLLIPGAAADAAVVGSLFDKENTRYKYTRVIPEKIIDENTSFPSTRIYIGDGTYHNYTNFVSTRMIDISELSGKEFVFDLFGFNRTVGGRLVNVCSIAFFDSSQNFISGAIYPGTTTSAGIKYSSAVNIPATAKYATFIKNTTQTFDPAVYVVNAGVQRIKIACVGDSLTQGLEQHLGGGSYRFVDKPYPVVLMESFETNESYFVEVLNFGRRGLSPITYWNGAIPPTGQYNSPGAGEPGDVIAFDPTINVVVIMLGTNGNLTNDTIDRDTQIGPGETYEDYANTHCGCYCKIIEYIQENTDNNASIIIAIPPFTANPTYKDKIINSIHTINALGERYSIPVINPFYEAGINEFNKDAFMYTGDYVHMVQKGYTKIGRYIANRIASYMDPINIE